jgi:hypothetical protein
MFETLDSIPSIEKKKKKGIYIFSSKLEDYLGLHSVILAWLLRLGPQSSHH